MTDNQTNSNEEIIKEEKIEKRVNRTRRNSSAKRTEEKPETKYLEIKENTRTKRPYNRRRKTEKVESDKAKKEIPNIETTSKEGAKTRTRKRREKSIFKKPSLKIIPLGGIHEIGKNITVFEYDNEIIVVDCGLSFPEDDMLGIDLVIPDITYLEKNVEKIKGLVITHGHEDHIGAVPYLLKKINIPIYATKLTAGLIKNKLEEHKLLRSTDLHEVVQGQTIKLGKNFKVEFIRSSHSIPDSVMLAITTPAGTILHTGDFKVDYTPIDGKIMDFGRIAELGNKGILA